MDREIENIFLSAQQSVFGQADEEVAPEDHEVSKILQRWIARLRKDVPITNDAKARARQMTRLIPHIGIPERSMAREHC